MAITNIIHLFRAYFIENKKRLLLYCIITLGIAIYDFTTSVTPELSPFLPFLLLCITAGTFFQHSLKNNNRNFFFNLPVSTAEKFTCSVLIILILAIVLLSLQLAGSYIGWYLARPVFGLDMTFHPIFQGVLYMSIPTGLGACLFHAMLISIFLFGSIYFKKNALFKTLASGAGFVAGVLLYYLLLFCIVFGKDLFLMNNINLDYMLISGNLIVFYIVMILFSLSLTYLRLKETEV